MSALSSNFKPLVAFFHAVDIDECIDAFFGLECDKVKIEYFPYPYPHRIAQNVFMANPEYSHLIMVPNDLVFEQKHLKQLERMVLEMDYPVCCGVCNVDKGKYEGYWNVTSNLPDLEYDTRKYKWISKGRYPNMIIEVPFAGFPATCIRRDVLEKCKINQFITPNKTKEAPIWETRGGYSNDLIFCHNLHDLQIPIKCDTSIIMNHYRYLGTNQIGKKSMRVKLFKYNENKKNLCQCPKQ